MQKPNGVFFAVLFLLALSSLKSFAQDTPSILKSGPLEQQAARLRSLVLAKENLPNIPDPVELDAIDRAYREIYSVVVRIYLAEDRDGGLATWDDYRRLRSAHILQARLAQLGSRQNTESQRNMLLYLDSELTRDELCSAQLKMLLETLDRYSTVKRLHQVNFAQEREDELRLQLVEIEELVLLRLRIAKIMVLTSYAKSLAPAVADRDVNVTIANARAQLPEAYRQLSHNELSSKALEAESKICVLPGLNDLVQAYFELIAFHHAKAVETEGKLSVKKADPAERRNLCRKRTVCAVELADFASRLIYWNSELLRIDATQHHVGHNFVVSPMANATLIDSPKESLNWLDYFDARATGDIAHIRDFVKQIEEQQLRVGFGERVEDWWVKRGRELPYRLIDAIIDDTATWLKDMPATSNALKEEIRHIAGYPKEETLYRQLSPEEQKKVHNECGQSIKDMIASFDRSRIDNVLNDLRLIEELQKAYPPRSLVLVNAPMWADSPTSRLSLAKCVDLPDRAAAQAHLLAHQQLANDLRHLAEEQREFVLRTNLSISMHLRAAAGEE